MAAHQSSFEAVAKVGLLVEGEPFSVQLSDGTNICLVKAGTAIHAFEDRCTHKDFALSGGDILNECIIRCPWHGAQFDVRSGDVVSGPATDGLTMLEVRVQQETILVSSK